MVEYISLNCLKCGGQLQITSSTSQFTCPYCKTEHLVNPENGMISFAQLINGIQSVRVGVDKTAAELAINRLKDEYQQLQIDEEIKNIKGTLWADGFDIYNIRRIIFPLIKKENPDKEIGLFKSLVFSKAELKDKLFSDLSSNDVKLLIDACEESGAESLLDAASLLKKLLIITEQGESIKNEIEKYKKIINST